MGIVIAFPRTFSTWLALRREQEREAAFRAALRGERHRAAIHRRRALRFDVALVKLAGGSLTGAAEAVPPRDRRRARIFAADAIAQRARERRCGRRAG